MLRVPPADRDRLIAWMRQHGVGFAVYYPIPFHRQPCFQALGTNPDEFPVADAAAASALALPIFQGLTEAEQIEVVGTIAKFAR